VFFCFVSVNVFLPSRRCGRFTFRRRVAYNRLFWFRRL
jgi:hypothetical protein